MQTPNYADTLRFGGFGLCICHGFCTVFPVKCNHNKNIGRQFVNRAKDYAKEIGATRLELTVWGFNKNAREFYEHLGISKRTIRMEMNIE
jgi:RimJ/RimL family protein N-acetyltransferase